MERDCDHDDDTTTSTDTAKKCPMMMYFHGGHCERILWTGWVASTVTSFGLSCFAMFVISFLYEMLKYFRAQLMRKQARKEAERQAAELRIKHMESSGDGPVCSNAPLAEVREQSYWQIICDKPHVIQSLLNLVQIVISYFLMLIFMLFNYWLCLSVILGLALGYFFFGWVKKDPQESECCP